MKLSIKLISALLAVMFVIVPFASCNGDVGSTNDSTGENNQTTAPTVNEDGVELFAEPIVI